MDTKSMSTEALKHTSNHYCWIHLQDLRFFLFLGANIHEKKIGQNIRIDLALKLKYENTMDKLENTLDYSMVIEKIKQEIYRLKEVNLLEYLCEQLLNSIRLSFSEIVAAKIVIEKGYVPLQNFTGKVRIEAEKDFLKP